MSTSLINLSKVQQIPQHTVLQPMQHLYLILSLVDLYIMGISRIQFIVQYILSYSIQVTGVYSTVWMDFGLDVINNSI